MLKILRGIALMLLALFVTTAAYGQQAPQGRWWRTPRYVKALDLTNAEVRRLEDAFNTSRLKMIKLKSQVESEQFKLQNLLEKSNLDEAAVRAQNRKLEHARTALADERSSFVLKVRKIIGPQRFQKLSNMR